MADSAQNKSESASPRRREEARERGQTASSSELASGLFLVLMLGLISHMGPILGGKLIGLMRTSANSITEQREWSVDRTVDLWQACMAFLFDFIVLILVAAVVIGSLGFVLQVGFRATPKSLSFDPSKLSPTNGIKRILSLRGGMRTVLALAKFTFCTFAMAAVAYARWDSFSADYDLASAVNNGWRLALLAGIVGALAFATLGLLDFAFQRWKHEQDLMMTKQEVRDETKENEGDPLVKRRIRKLQTESANLRSVRDVPMASVVITNPTHFAVALRYERGSKAAPRVVSKGADLLAKRIRRTASATGVPIVERKEVARFLYATTPIGGEIPPTIYRAVAEILAHVLNLRRRAA